jgi:hypothetical protein
MTRFSLASIRLSPTLIFHSKNKAFFFITSNALMHCKDRERITVRIFQVRVDSLYWLTETKSNCP